MGQTQCYYFFFRIWNSLLLRTTCVTFNKKTSFMLADLIDLNSLPYNLLNNLSK